MEGIMNIIPFGSKVRDKITGFTGFVVVRIEHMNNCVRYGVQPPLNKEKQLPEEKIFDGPNLEVTAPPKSDLSQAIENPNAFELGVKVKDLLTGFTGIAVLRVKNKHSGDRYGVQPPMNKKAEIPDLKTFAEEDLLQIDPPVPKKKTPEEPQRPNGPHDHRPAIAR